MKLVLFVVVVAEAVEVEYHLWMLLQLHWPEPALLQMTKTVWTGLQIVEAERVPTQPEYHPAPGLLPHLSHHPRPAAVGWLRCLPRQTDTPVERQHLQIPEVACYVYHRQVVEAQASRLLEAFWQTVMTVLQAVNYWRSV
jgi:hypothetical protein